MLAQQGTQGGGVENRENYQSTAKCVVTEAPVDLRLGPVRYAPGDYFGSGSYVTCLPLGRYWITKLLGLGFRR